MLEHVPQFKNGPNQKEVHGFMSPSYDYWNHFDHLSDPNSKELNPTTKNYKRNQRMLFLGCL